MCKQRNTKENLSAESRSRKITREEVSTGRKKKKGAASKDDKFPTKRRPLLKKRRFGSSDKYHSLWTEKIDKVKLKPTSDSTQESGEIDVRSRNRFQPQQLRRSFTFEPLPFFLLNLYHFLFCITLFTLLYFAHAAHFIRRLQFRLFTS